MGVEARSDITNVAFILEGSGAYRDPQTILQDAGRSGDIVAQTLMAYNPTSKKWVPFTDETATDGTQFPRGILLDTITEAAIVAGDVEAPILVRGEIVDKTGLVIENSKTLDTIINEPLNLNTSVQDFLAMVGILVEATIDIDEFENA